MQAEFELTKQDKWSQTHEPCALTFQVLELQASTIMRKVFKYVLNFLIDIKHSDYFFFFFFLSFSISPPPPPPPFSSLLLGHFLSLLCEFTCIPVCLCVGIPMCMEVCIYAFRGQKPNSTITNQAVHLGL